MAHYLVTGAAGFIGARVAELLLGEKHKVVGVDNVNDAYDVRLKQWRLDRLLAREDFHFHRADIRDRAALAKAAPKEPVQGLGDHTPAFLLRPSRGTDR